MARPFTILLAVDFSRSSVAAMEHARHLANHTAGKILLVHVEQPVSGRSGAASGAPSDDLVPESEAVHAWGAGEGEGDVDRLVQEWLEALREDGTNVEVVTKTGAAAEVILDVADEHEADVLVVGRQGAGGLRRIFLGSVTRHLVAHSTRPVMVVPLHE